MSPRETVEVELSGRDRQLILKYGYPFEGIEAAIRACGDSQDWEVFEFDRFEVEKLIGDLSISINEDTRGRLQSELLDLCERLEYAEKGYVW